MQIDRTPSAKARAANNIHSSSKENQQLGNRQPSVRWSQEQLPRIRERRAAATTTPRRRPPPPPPQPPARSGRGRARSGRVKMGEGRGTRRGRRRERGGALAGEKKGRGGPPPPPRPAAGHHHHHRSHRPDPGEGGPDPAG